MGLKITTIASSSKGNCVMVSDNSVNLLIDMGISVCSLRSALTSFNMSIEDIDGILITHEHCDHVLGLKSLLTSHNIPVYANRDTMRYVKARYGIKACTVYDIVESGFSIGSIDIEPFRTRHDAIYSVGFTLSSGGMKVGIATDLGSVTEAVLNNLSGCYTVMLESNHDVMMLRNGDYPPYLKRRILGNAGHLSNDECAETIAKLVRRGTKKFILAHLSENNNTARLAYSAVYERLIKDGICLGRDIELDVAAPRLLLEQII